MDERRTSELGKYLRPGIGRLFLAAAFVILGLILVGSGVKGMIADRGDTDPLVSAAVIALFPFAFGIYAAKNTVSELLSWRKFMNALPKHTDAEKMLDDFEHGVQLINGSVRLGDKYFAGKGSVTMFRYDDIGRVCEYIRTSRKMGTVEEHSLVIVDVGGTVHQLCKLSTRSTSQDLVKVFAMMKFKNEKLICG